MLKKRLRIIINKSTLSKLFFLLFSDLIVFSFLCIISNLIMNQRFGVHFFVISFSIIIFKISILIIFNIHKIILTYFGLPDMFKILAVSLGSSIVVWSILEILYHTTSIGIVNLEIEVAVLVAISEVFLLISVRFVKRVSAIVFGLSGRTKPTLIVGAGSGARLVYDEINNNPQLKYRVVAFIDDDPDKIGRRLLGKKVHGPIKNVHEILNKHKIEDVIIAIAAISSERLHEIIKVFEHEKVRLKKIPSIAGTKANEKMGITDFSLEELLNRETVSFDTSEITSFLTDKVVLITGAGGSIGSELSYQVLSHKPKKIILLDIYENGVYDVEQTIKRKIASNPAFAGIEYKTIIASTYNKERIENIFVEYKPQVVYHAAAYKHVPLMEDNPQEAIRTNVLGTYNVAEMANKYKAQKMIFVSTDKAVRPTNVMGATKRFAEMILSYFKTISVSTAYSSVRFGNVLGSSGSAIPLFEKQIQEGGPVTITDPNIIRYFMTIPEAVSLILQCSVYAKSGEIFVLDMGEPIKVVTIAENLIKQAGYIPYEDIKIKIIGLRPGEKLYEELLVDIEKATKTDNKKIYIESNEEKQSLDCEMRTILSALTITDNDEVRKIIQSVVTDFKCNVRFHN